MVIQLNIPLDTGQTKVIRIILSKTNKRCYLAYELTRSRLVLKLQAQDG